MATTALLPETPLSTEDYVSQIPALHLLMRLGYKYLLPREAAMLRGGRLSEVLLTDVVAAQLRQLNVIEFKGEKIPFSEGNIDQAIRALRNVGDDGLLRTNEKIWQLLRLGKALPQVIDGDAKSFTLRYVDWEHPDRNIFHVTDEFEVAASGITESRRPDIVLFVNGIPFAVIECKSPNLPPGKNPVDEAISQQLRNQRETEIPRLFHYAQLLLSVSMNAASYGAVGTPSKFWSVWQESKLDETSLQRLTNESMPQPDADRFFSANDPAFHHRFRGTTPARARRWFEAWVAAGHEVNNQDRTLYALCRPERLLELADRFTVFEAGERKIARHQQYRCVQLAMARLKHLDARGERQGGVVWHTQGSGKSLTMVMLAEAIAREPSIQDSRIVLVTDRVDLDDQLYEVFANCGAEAVQATTGRNLLDLLRSPRARIITTVLNKFQSALRNRVTPIESAEIFVLVDESHRTQFGELHAAMKRVLPRACFIGFTGTPVAQNERSTINRFGGLIDTYTIVDAEADRAVVPLLYEGRHVHQSVDQIPIDAWFDRYTAGLSADQRAELKRHYSTPERLNSAEQKIRAIAWDISVHFSTQWKGTGFKAQLVAASKGNALRYLRFLEEFGLVSSEVLISPPDTREGNDEVDPAEDSSDQQKVVAFWERMMRRYGSEKEYQDDLIRRFKGADEPEILIVVNKLLTGFDAPRNTVLYLSREFRDHTLLQAIARVNRLADGKDYGYILDYAGVLTRLGEAIDLYNTLQEDYETGSLDGILRDISSEWQKLPQLHTLVWDVFRGVGNPQDQEAMERALAAEEIRHSFYERFSGFVRSLKLSLGSSDFHVAVRPEVIERYKTDLRYFGHLRASAARRYGERVDFREYQVSIQKLLDTHVGAGEVETIVEPVSIFNREALQAEIDALDSPRAKAELIANRTRRTITERMDQDPAFYKRFSEMLAETILASEQQRIEDAEYLKRVEEIRDQVRDRTGDDMPEVLDGRDVAKAYYGVLEESLPVSEIREAPTIGAELALRVEQILDSLRITDWTTNLDVQNQMKTAIEDELLRFAGEKGFSLTYDRIDEILDQCLAIARLRRPQSRTQ